MKRWTCRFLAPICSLLVLMPVGWCCWLLPNEQADEIEAEAMCCHSCCLAPKEKKPVKPTEAPKLPSCICELPTAHRIVPDETDVALPSLTLLVTSDLVACLEAIGVKPANRINDAPPLHVLHCLWLC